MTIGSGYPQGPGLPSATVGSTQPVMPLGIDGTEGEALTIAIISDSTGADGFNASNPAASQVFDSIAWWTAAYSGGALKIGTTCSVGGWTTADVDLWWDKRVAAAKVKFPIIAIGLNDIYGATDATVPYVEGNLRTWYLKKVLAVRAWGGVPVIQTIFPVGSNYFAATATKRKYAYEHNKWRRRLARALNLPLLDAEELLTDPASATANPYASYFQGNGSPHAGHEMQKQLGKNLWDNGLPNYVNFRYTQQANQFTGDSLFTNPGFAGTGGNLNGGAGTLPDSVWGWNCSGTTTTFAITPSTDSKFDFSGAPVKSPWISVTTDQSTISAAGAGASVSSEQPGLLFFTSGLNIPAGSVITASMEISVDTPNGLVGFSIGLQDNTGTYSSSGCNPSNSFTPANNADNAKNEIKGTCVITIPEITLTIPVDLEAAGIWCLVTAQYSGVTGATGNSVWKIRNFRMKLAPALA